MPKTPEERMESVRAVLKDNPRLDAINADLCRARQDGYLSWEDFGYLMDAQGLCVDLMIHAKEIGYE